MLSKILAGGLTLSLVACLFLYSLLKSSEADLAAARAKVEILSSVNDTNQKAIGDLTQLAKENSAAIVESGKNNEKILLQSLSYQTDNNNLRLTEAESALAMPFERGNASYDRITTQLLRFSGDDKSTLGTSNDQAGNTSGSNAP